MFRRVGTTLGFASLAFALLTGPITHVHPRVDGHGAVRHAHFLAGHPAHPHGGAAFDHDDAHARVSYVNPYLSVATHARSLVMALTRVVALPAPPAMAIQPVWTPTERAHGPPCVSVRPLRGPPVRLTSA